ncbi:MAG: hypothetical protein H7Y61_10600, partial [Rhizobiales bacterium]|nr:hypothetical protein [Rhizobacter sp.]
APCSIASVGFALSAYPIGVEREWIGRTSAVERCLRVLRFLQQSDQSGTAEGTGFNGFYFHFLDMETGKRVWQCELSMIDSAILFAGFLTAAAYFDAETPEEVELRQLAHALYDRVDWRWAQNGKDAVTLGWKPEHGFMSYGWEGYSEALVMYALGLGAPRHALGEASFRAWTTTYQWENLYGYDVLYAGPLFIHQLSHAWLDLRGIRDDFMREKGLDYFENSRRAAYVQREYACRNPLGFKGYGEACWGLSACEGPHAAAISMAGRRQSFFGYAARGAPFGPDDGTVAGPGALGSIVFAPEIVLPVVRNLLDREEACTGRRALASGFNATVPSDDAAGWVSEHMVGFDQGLIALMIENHRSGLIWRLMRECSVVRTGLARCGFRGGWLDARR